MDNLEDVLAARTREGSLFERSDGAWVRCYACGHECPIPDGASGVCKVRFNRGGALMLPWGYVAGAQADPIEKKPFFHVMPDSVAFSFGMLGCDFHCSYCQNWLSSQTLRDPDAEPRLSDVTASAIARRAVEMGARSVVSTYNEPLITAEWAVDVFILARAAGLKTGFVSNGNATARVLDFLAPHLDFFKVDLKCFDDKKYRTLGGRLQPVLDTIAGLRERRIWIEVVTLLVPGFNDSDEELGHLAGFLREVSPDIPWHLTAFHPDYRMADRPRTSPDLLRRAAAIGASAGLRYVYAGNLPGQVGSLEDTRCPACGRAVVRRRGYRIDACDLGSTGACPDCGTLIPGIWNQQA